MQVQGFQLFGPSVVDGYKLGHRPMYPNGTSMLYANSTARSDKIFKRSPSCSSMWDGKILVTGQVAALKEIVAMWQTSFFNKPKEEVIKRFKRRCDNYVGRDKVPVDSISNLHDIGHLPLIILSVEEGTRLPIGVPMYVLYDTNGNLIDEGSEFYWLAEYVETVMSNMTWKQVTVGTIAFEYRRVLTKFAALTGAPRDFVKFQAHDFSYRGMSGMEDGARCGAAHLRVFTGSDTVSAIDYVEDMYHANVETAMVAGTIPATEHSVATANILFRLKQLIRDQRAAGVAHEDIPFKALRLQAEREFIKEMITVKFPTGNLGLVCDSFDFWGVLTDVLPSLREEILARQPDENGMAKLVIRPDSGDPVEIICGVEIHNEEDGKALMMRAKEDKPNVVYIRDDEGLLWRATKLPEGQTTRGIASIRAELPESVRGKWDEWTEELFGKANGFDYPFPISVGIDVDTRWEAYRGMIDLLNELGIDYMTHGKGTYRAGYKIEEHTLNHEEKGAIELLWDTFGGTETELGFKVLHDRIGLIYGDSITVQRAEEIMRRLMKKGFASCNVVFGVGSYTYNYITRDTFGIAVKATACSVQNEIVELYKDPATGDGLKRSAKGLLSIGTNEAGEPKLNQEQEMKMSEVHLKSGLLQPLYMNGDWPMDPTHAEICAKVDAHIDALFPVAA